MSKKIAKMRVSKEYLEMVLRADVFTQPNTIVKSNAPKDLEVLGLDQSRLELFGSATFWVYVTSDTFKEIPEGADIPEIPPFTYEVVRMETA